MSEQLLDLSVVVTADLDHDRALLLARLADRLGYARLVLDPGRTPVDERALRDLLAGELTSARVCSLGDLATVVPAARPATVERARAAAPAGAPVIARVSMAIGRTLNEATTRAAREPRYTGELDPRTGGVFGSTEQAQEQVLALRRAGATELLVDPPAEDPADLLAQVRALVVGATPRLFTSDERPRQ